MPDEEPEEEVKEEPEEKEVKETDTVGEVQEEPNRYCTVCKKKVVGTGKKKNICPICGSFTKRLEPRPEPTLTPTAQRFQKKDIVEEPEYEMESTRAVKLGGRDMALAEILINAGLAKDFSDLTRKGLYVMSAMFNLGSINNPIQMTDKKETQQEPDPRKLSKELLEQQMLRAYVKNLERGSEGDPLQLMMLMKLMDKGGEEKEKGSNFMDKIIEAQIVKSLTSNNPDSHLMKELADLRFQLQQQQLINQLKEQGSKNPLQDQLMALEKIRAERDQKIREAELKAQAERDKTLKLAMDTKLKEMERQIQEAQASGGSLSAQRLREFKEELKAVKEMATEIGAREKGAGEYISETVDSIAKQVGPVVQDYIKAKEQQKQQETQELIAQGEIEPQTPPEPAEPAQTPPSDLTETERQMSEQMSDMYIKKRE